MTRLKYSTAAQEASLQSSSFKHLSISYQQGDIDIFYNVLKFLDRHTLANRSVSTLFAIPSASFEQFLYGNTSCLNFRGITAKRLGVQNGSVIILSSSCQTHYHFQNMLITPSSSAINVKTIHNKISLNYNNLYLHILITNPHISY